MGYNYWDRSTHIYGNLEAANAGKNVNTPLQDVSSIVTGEVLWDITIGIVVLISTEI